MDKSPSQSTSIPSIPDKRDLICAEKTTAPKQWFSNFRTVPRVVVTPTIQIFLFLFHNCNFATIINVTVVQVSKIQDLWAVTPVKRSITSCGSGDSQVRTSDRELDEWAQKGRHDSSVQLTRFKGVSKKNHIVMKFNFY